jgi:hypothetical protein
MLDQSIYRSSDEDQDGDHPQPDVQDHSQRNRELIIVRLTKRTVLSKVVAYHIDTGHMLGITSFRHCYYVHSYHMLLRRGIVVYDDYVVERSRPHLHRPGLANCRPSKWLSSPSCMQFG